MLSETCVILVQLSVYIGQLEQTVQQLQQQVAMLEATKDAVPERKSRRVSKPH